jgi:hypothetical protein
MSDLRALQTELKRLEEAVDPQRGLKETVTLAIGMIHRYGTGVVHVDGGRLKNSLFWDVQSSARRASASWGTNVSYSIYEEARGGSHAFVSRTERQEGPNVARLFHVRISGGRT